MLSATLLIASCSSKPVDESSEPVIAAMYVAAALVREGESKGCNAKCKEETKQVQASIKNHSKH